MSLVDPTGKDIYPAVEELSVPNPPTEGQPPPKMKEIPEDMAVGYIVGLKEGGEFVFEVLGKEPGLIQLLGIHQYATHRLEVAKDINQAYGPALLAEQHKVLAQQCQQNTQGLEQLHQMMKVMLNMLTNQAKNSMLVK